uniref:Uncharacterized protein n=1 Tax=Anguilla anguilla TaxID=7936 RepID=A0A0E9RLZ8_ANGAN
MIGFHTVLHNCDTQYRTSNGFVFCFFAV